MKNRKKESAQILASLLRDEAPAVPVHQEHELYLLGWCEEHGLGGFLHKHRDAYFSAEFSSYLAKTFKRNLQRNVLFLEEYQNLCAIARSNDLAPPVALKGLSLLQRVHSLGERPLTDMDILVPSQDLNRWTECLIQFGYRPRVEKTWSANSHKSVFVAHRNGLDITLEAHTKLFYNQPNEWWPPTETYGSLQILSPEIEIIYLSAHLVHQHTFLKLFWLMDLHRLTGARPESWNENLITLAQRLQVKTSVTAVAYCMKNLFGHDIEAHTKKSILWFLNWPTLISISDSRWTYLCLKHTTKDSWNESLAYDLKWLYFRMENTLFNRKSPKEIER